MACVITRGSTAPAAVVDLHCADGAQDVTATTRKAAQVAKVARTANGGALAVVETACVADGMTAKAGVTGNAAGDVASMLRERGIQVTAQRLAVFSAVSARPHATADELVDDVRAGIGAVSRQAVFDALTLLTEERLIRRIQPARSPARYEDRVDDNHHHLVCRGCGSTADVDCAVGYRPCLEAADDSGFLIDEAEVIYWGFCPGCQAASAEPVRH